MNGGREGPRLAVVNRRRSPGLAPFLAPEFSQPAPGRRTGLGPQEGEAIPAAPARGGSAAGAVHSEGAGDSRGGGRGLRGRGAAPSCRLLSFFHPGVSRNGNGPRPGRSARMKGGARTLSGASSRRGGGNWQRRGCPATPASQSGRRGQPRPSDRGPQRTPVHAGIIPPRHGAPPRLLDRNLECLLASFPSFFWALVCPRGQMSWDL